MELVGMLLDVGFDAGMGGSLIPRRPKTLDLLHTTSAVLAHADHISLPPHPGPLPQNATAYEATQYAEARSRHERAQEFDKFASGQHYVSGAERREVERHFAIIRDESSPEAARAASRVKATAIMREKVNATERQLRSFISLHDIKIAKRAGRIKSQGDITDSAHAELAELRSSRAAAETLLESLTGLQKTYAKLDRTYQLRTTSQRLAGKLASTGATLHRGFVRHRYLAIGVPTALIITYTIAAYMMKQSAQSQAKQKH